MRIVVAMSGGVDSSVAAARLVGAGHDVIGVHLRLHDHGASAVPAARQKTCCGLDDAADASQVADTLGIPLYVWNLREAFQRAVIDDFVGEYLDGRTPNPCVHCNGVLKFRVLLARARALGATHLATGHYARILHEPDGPVLATATDPSKDQSYFLFPMSADALAHTLFPLGDTTKDVVRAEAAALGLATAAKPESQDVCFLPTGDHTGFVAVHGPSGLDGAGPICTEDGREVGAHDGYWRFTVGQRRGLGVAAPEPLYVLRVEPSTRTVVVGPAARLEHTVFVADRMTWGRRPADGAEVGVRTRHRGPIARARVQHLGDDTVRIALCQPLRAVSPGQAAVVYDGPRVLGGGWIRHAEAVAA